MLWDDVGVNKIKFISAVNRLIGNFPKWPDTLKNITAFAGRF